MYSISNPYTYPYAEYPIQNHTRQRNSAFFIALFIPQLHNKLVATTQILLMEEV